MKTVRDVMKTEVIRLNPTNKVKTAIILMKGHNIGGIPVLEDDRVVGIIEYQDVLGKPNDVAVENLMTRDFAPIPPTFTIPEAADCMTKMGSSRLLVMEGSRLVGIVTQSDLLPELGKSIDPLTGLVRVDTFRDWGISALRSGCEITVIFIDLNDFGMFNKKYGHIMGDNVIKYMAEILKSCVDEERDLLCRYAGDEFAIVTLRHAEESKQLIDKLYNKMATSHNPEIPEPVTGSIGMYGGKRSKEREQTHYEATMDNLINLASKACIAAKPKKETAAAPAPDGAGSPTPVVPGNRIRLRGLNFAWLEESYAAVEVELANGEVTHKKATSGYAFGRNALRLVTDAAAGALTEFLPKPGYGIIAENVTVIDSGNDEDIVLAVALIVTPQKQARVSGSAIVQHDVYRAAVMALLDATNRFLET